MTKFYLIFLALFSGLSFAQVQTVDSIKNFLREKNIRTMEEFISELPQDLLTNYTLMHDSKSLHGSSYEEPRAMLFGKTGQWVVTFNGSKNQAAGSMVEMMIYDPQKKTYAFHELDFSKDVPVLHENPMKCLACHGSNPRPIWDHYNMWPGAYGAVDDRYSEQEYAYLETFIKKAPEHPRYKHLKKLKEGYTLSRPGFRNGLSERSMVSRNRDMNIVLNQQRMKDVVKTLTDHPDFPKVKGLIFYLLTKCYIPDNSTYQGDGQIGSTGLVAEMFKKIAKGERPEISFPIQPEMFLDYIFSRLEVDTYNWYINSRDLPTYRVFRDGSERLHESFLTYFLQSASEYADYYQYKDVDYQINYIRQAIVKNKKSACEDLAETAAQGISVLRKPLPEVNVPEQTMKGERVCSGTPVKCRIIYRILPQICLKCHAQQTGTGKIYLPFHEFPERADRNDTYLIERMYNYVNTGRMPMRTGGDANAFRQYVENDFLKLKKYLEELLKVSNP